MKSHEWKSGRWVVSSSDDWEGVFEGTYSSLSEAIEAGPALMRAEGYGPGESFCVAQLRPARLQFPEGLAETVVTACLDATFRHWDERPDVTVSDDAREELRTLLHAAIRGWEDKRKPLRDCCVAAGFQEFEMPAEVAAR